MTGKAQEFPWELDYLPKLPQNRDMGIGCIGAGFIMADCHLVSYKKAGLQPVAIASQNMENAKQVGNRHQIPLVYENYHKLLIDPQVEILDIAVPPDVQLDVVRKAVEHNDHIRGILAQKPLGMNLAEAREIVKLCDEAGIALAVNQNMRY
ncbi:MAG: Gfo/Idh/MocA family oxidoreductase, partial [Planctomycetaceae bacterium]|nr:Gfo/Idh/MocA family oxidoreductase [Planctomycetaceae bacterium]